MKFLTASVLALLAFQCANAQLVRRRLLIPHITELSIAQKMKIIASAGINNAPQLQGVCTLTPAQPYDQKNDMQLRLQGGMYTGAGPTMVIGGYNFPSMISVDGPIDPTKNYLVTFYGENMQTKPAVVHVIGGHQADVMTLHKGNFSIPIVTFPQKGQSAFEPILRMDADSSMSIYIYKVTVEKVG